VRHIWVYPVKKRENRDTIRGMESKDAMKLATIN